MREGERESETEWLRMERVWVGEKDPVRVVVKVLTKEPVGDGEGDRVRVDGDAVVECVSWEAVPVGEAEWRDNEPEERDRVTVAVERDCDTTVGLAEVGVWERDWLSVPVCEALRVPAQDRVGEWLSEVGDMDELWGVRLGETLWVGDAEGLCGCELVTVRVTDIVAVRWGLGEEVQDKE